MSVLRTLTIAVLLSLVLGVGASVLTACSDDGGGVVLDEPVDAGPRAEAGAHARR